MTWLCQTTSQVTPLSAQTWCWRKTHGHDLFGSWIMQQTQVERVIPRWHAWVEKRHTIEALAATSPSHVIVEQQGLRYNGRALRRSMS